MVDDGEELVYSSGQSIVLRHWFWFEVDHGSVLPHSGPILDRLHLGRRPAWLPRKLLRPWSWKIFLPLPRYVAGEKLLHF